MKMYESLLAACIAGGLFCGTSQQGSAQEISKPASATRTSGDFSGLKSSKASKVGSLSILSGESIAARQSEKSRKPLGALGVQKFSGVRQAATDRTSAMAQAGQVSPLKLALSKKQATLGGSIRSSKVSDRGQLSRPSAVSARSSKFRTTEASSSVATDLLTQPRLVK